MNNIVGLIQFEEKDFKSFKYVSEFPREEILKIRKENVCKQKLFSYLEDKLGTEIKNICVSIKKTSRFISYKCVAFEDIEYTFFESIYGGKYISLKLKKDGKFELLN